jgi:ubiquinone/menaquinone biosynthesis C-methylase UbiE
MISENNMGGFSRPNPKTVILADAIRREMPRKPANLLVVGCGSGIEAATLACELDCVVIGIDIQTRFDPEAQKFAALKEGDATRLEFSDGEFDVVYSFHALEHIYDDRLAVSEMRRVLKPDGLLCIGTPNRSRVIGYIGSQDVGWATKFLWNLIDWKARLLGRFRNEYGAHAGYTEKELQTILSGSFRDVRSITDKYYLKLYSSRQALVELLKISGMSRLLFPSIYFLCR